MSDLQLVLGALEPSSHLISSHLSTRLLYIGLFNNDPLHRLSTKMKSKPVNSRRFLRSALMPLILNITLMKNIEEGQHPHPSINTPKGIQSSQT